MKYLAILTLLIFELNAQSIESKIISIDTKNASATIKVQKINVGMSGLIVQNIAPKHNVVIHSTEVIAYDALSKIATIKIQKYDAIENKALPQGELNIKKGDSAFFALHYNRAMLLAPNEKSYYAISKIVKVNWIHPDIFAAMLSLHGHPKPLKEDFANFQSSMYVGLLFIFVDNHLYMLDAKTFKILTITSFKQNIDKEMKPFYRRIKNIEANMWGDGSEGIEEYTSYYYELLALNNKKSKELHKIIQNADKKYRDILENFTLGK